MCEIEKKDLICPVCHELMICPRIYECGHTICERCMAEIEKEENDKHDNIFIAISYKCPVCRKKTHIPYLYRPRNIFLMTILEKNEEYRKKIQDIRYVNQDNLLDIPNNINLAYLSARSKILKCDELYSYILPILFKAALDGKSEISIKENAKDFQSVAEELSQKLFENNGIYRVISRPTLFTVEILKIYSENVYCDIINPRLEYVNPNFTSNIPYISSPPISDEESSI